MTSTTTMPAVPAVPAVTVEELALAWQAVRSGQFRTDQQAAGGDWATGDEDRGLMLAVVGAHGWSGASTTALLIADAAARQGRPVRVVDVASPARSGFAAAAITEHGVDETGRWRQGSRGPLVLQRLAQPVTRLAAVPAPRPATVGTLTVLDTSWPVTDLFALQQENPAGRHWLSAVLRSAPLVITARATIPGLRQAEASMQALAGWRGPDAPMVMALLGPGTLPRVLTASAGEAVLAAHRADLVVAVPDRQRRLTRTGLTPAPLPRQLHRTGDQLLALTHPLERHHARPDTQTGTSSLMSQLTTRRKDDSR
jgi:hypothetical protein